MLVGIGFVAVLTGAIAQTFIAPAEQRDEASDIDLRASSTPSARLEHLETALVPRPAAGPTALVQPGPAPPPRQPGTSRLGSVDGPQVPTEQGDH